MADTIRRIIESVFWNSPCHGGYHKFEWNSQEHHNFNIKYIDIPIDSTSFEVPMFAYPTFLDMVKNKKDERSFALVAKLHTHDDICKYKSIEAIMKSVLMESCWDNLLTRVEVQQDGNTIVYYATHGTVFNQDFIPIMMCSWLVYTSQRYKNDGNSETYYTLKKPLLRISPDVFLNKSDPMERYLANKIPVTCLEDAVYAPYREDERIHEIHNRYKVKIEIDECPFTVRNAEVPSISTTNSDLLKLAADHIEELIQ